MIRPECKFILIFFILALFGATPVLAAGEIKQPTPTPSECPPNNPPIFDPPLSDIEHLKICLGATIYDTIRGTDPDTGNILTLTKVSGPGTFSSVPHKSPVYGYFSWTPTEPGQFPVVFSVADTGITVYDTIVYEVTFNQPPVAQAQDTSVYFCWDYETICRSISASDPDGDRLTYRLLTGPGTVDTTGTVCFLPTEPGIYQFSVKVSDVCGADTASFSVTVTANHDPAIVPYDTVIALCEPETICLDVNAYDPDPNDSLELTLISGPGVFTQTADGTGLHCFYPDLIDSARYVFVFGVTDDCWRNPFQPKNVTPPPSPRDSIVVIVVVNQPPVISCPENPEEFLCAPDTICYQIGALDPDNDPLKYKLLLGPGKIDSLTGWYCFYAKAEGAYMVVVEASDPCGNVDTCRFTATVHLNQPPVVIAPPDTAVLACEPQPICLSGFIVRDPEDNISQITFQPPLGTYDNGVYCFTPDTVGTYRLIVRVTDVCGAFAEDTIRVSFAVGQGVTLTCPEGVQQVNLCTPDTICVDLPVSPLGSPVSVISGPGWYEDGKLCIYADAAGEYRSTVVATGECGNDTCEVVFAVTLGETPRIDCPEAFATRLCGPGYVEVPVGIYPADAIVTITPPAEYVDGRLRFYADHAGDYCFTVTASAECGSDTCDFCATVTFDVPPQVSIPDTAVFQCQPEEICLPVEYSDADGDIAEISIQPDYLQIIDDTICFMPKEAGEYEIIVTVTDLCGNSAVDTATVTVSRNLPPSVTAPADTTMPVCGPELVCLSGFAINDPDDNITRIEFFPPLGKYEDGNYCFTPDTAGFYCFVVRATDDCGEQDEDTICVTITMNAPPTVSVTDSTFFLCRKQQVCLPYSVSDPDNDIVSVIVSPKLYPSSAGQICFTPSTSGPVSFVVTVKDACGHVAADTGTAIIQFNAAPKVTVGDTTFIACDPGDVCVPVGASDPNDNIVSISVAAPGYYNGDDSTACLPVTASGNYPVIVIARDECGVIAADTGWIHATIIGAPILTCPPSQTVRLCKPDFVSLPLTVTPADARVTIIQPATYSKGVMTFNADTAGTYCFDVMAENECDLVRCNFCVTVVFDRPPTASLTDTVLSLCKSQKVCLPYDYFDPDNDIVSVNISPKSYPSTEGFVCFTPTKSGTYNFVLSVTDACGLTAVDTGTAVVHFNEGPSVSLGDTTVALCEPGQVCLPVTMFDPEGRIDSVKVSPPATFNAQDSTVCLNVTQAGRFNVIVTVFDECGVSARDTGTITAAINTPPVVTAPADTTWLACGPTEICLDGFTIYDADQNITKIEFIPPLGTYSDGEYCFPADTAGRYCLIARATDACGAVDEDTVCVTFTIGQAAVLTCPEGVQHDSLCAADTVCVEVPVSPAGTPVTVIAGSGWYKDGKLCVYADTSGLYRNTIVAVGDCGADTCVVEFKVHIGQTPKVRCPEAFSAHLCGPGYIQVPLSVEPPEASVVIIPPAEYENGWVRFYADTAGRYCFGVTATTECGADQCSFCATVTMDAPPQVSLPDTSVSQCEPGPICIPVTYSDPDRNIASVVVQPPSLQIVDGKICFTPPNAGTHTIIVTATDSCGYIDADTSTIQVTWNQPPQVSVPDSTLFSCGPREVCLKVTMSDPDGRIDSVRVSPPATFNSGNSTVCLNITQAGVYDVPVTVYDNCGVSDVDTGKITITFNRPPVVSLGSYPSPMYLCELSKICVKVLVSDPDNNATTVTSTVSCSPSATFNPADSTVCWTPTAFGTCLLTVVATDGCGAKDTVTGEIVVQQSPQPNPPCPRDTTVRVCGPTDVCVKLGTVQPGSHIRVVPTYYTYNPATASICYRASETRTDTVRVIDSTLCGMDTCKFVLRTILNSPPVIAAQAPEEFKFCHVSDLCINLNLSDPDNNIRSVTIEGNCPDAVYNATPPRICMTITEAIDCVMRVIVTDSCDAADTVNLPIKAVPNQPPVLHLPTIETIVRCQTDTATLVIGDICVTDPDYDDVSLTLDSGLGQLNFNPVTDCGVLSFKPPTNDSAVYCFKLKATDACDTVYSRYCINILPSVVCSTCINVSIAGPGCVNSGSVANVNIVAEVENDIGGYDLLIAYDASVLTFTRAVIGPAISGWEYFTYRFGAAGDCEQPCPSGLLRIVAIADINNGPFHPPVEQYHPDGVLATIAFRVSSDLNVGGQRVPVKFFWIDCGDNGFSDPTGQYLFVDQAIFGPEGNIIWDENNNAVYPESKRPMYVGAPDECLEGDKYEPIRCVNFHNGEICILHPDSIDARGDLNLNGVAYEIADAVVYTNYFVSGLSAFNISPAGQIAASDVNADGVPLSVADLVYLIRVIIGDADAYPKEPVTTSPVLVNCGLTGGAATVSVNSAQEIGAALLVFGSEGVRPERITLLDGARGMEMKYGWVNGNLQVLIFSLEAGRRIAAGESRLVQIDVPEGGIINLRSVEAADYFGRNLTVLMHTDALPKTLALSQNHPNPFNPVTTFELALPVASEYSVTVYNITGQVIRQWQGYAEAGYITFEWDGCDQNGAQVASGIYLYRAQAAGVEAIRKMVLLK